MSNSITFEQVEQLVVQLPPPEQLKLVAHISERLSQLLPAAQETDMERQRRDYAARVEAFLRMSDEMAAETIGEVDLTEDIRQIREERTARL